MKRIVLCLLVFALPAAAHQVFLDIDGKKVQVEVSGPPANSITTEGNSIAVWKPEDAEAIAAQLSREGLDWAIPQTLGALRVGDRTPACLTLDLDDYGTVQVTLPGKVATDRHGRAVWTPAQIEAVQAKLHDIGREDALPGLFGLTFPRVQVAAASSLGETPLAPGCGECLNGKTCSVNGNPDCCSGTGIACSKCKVCKAGRGIGGELP